MLLEQALRHDEPSEPERRCEGLARRAGVDHVVGVDHLDVMRGLDHPGGDLARAGDELERPTPETIIATGYYRLGIWQDEPVDPEQELYEDLDDLVRTKVVSEGRRTTIQATELRCSTAGDNSPAPSVSVAGLSAKVLMMSPPGPARR